MPRSSVSNSRARGVTKFELMIGCGLLTLVFGTGAAFYSGEQADARQVEARSVAKRLAGAVGEWKKDHGELGCPSVSQLLHEKRWSIRERADDPWGGRFRISCSEQQISVKSAGGDGQFETEDDIAVNADWNS